ncbi:MAG: proton-conducting transporter membrane subunit [Candidatus Paceibacterota bacterium]
MHKMRGLWKNLPVTFVVYLICTLAISAIYPLAGYFSKHEIILAVEESRYLGNFAWVLTLVSMLTVIYMTRSLYFVFLAKPKKAWEHLHQPSFLMNFPIAVLGFLTLIAGFIMPDSLDQFLSPSIKEFFVHDHLSSEALGHSILPLIIFLVTIFLIPLLIRYHNLAKVIFFLPRHKFFFDQIYYYLVVIPFRKLASLFELLIENATLRMIIDAFAATALVSSKCLSLIQNGQMRFYFGISIVGILFLMFFTVLF